MTVAYDLMTKQDLTTERERHLLRLVPFPIAAAQEGFQAGGWSRGSLVAVFLGAAVEQREVPSEDALFLLGQLFEGFAADADFRVLEGVEAGARGDQVAENHVFLEADQVIDLAGQSRFGEHLGCFLERGGRDEA